MLMGKLLQNNAFRFVSFFWPIKLVLHFQIPMETVVEELLTNLN